MEYTPPNQPPRPNPEAPRPDSHERNGFFDRWRTKKSKASPEAEQSGEAPKQDERFGKEKSRREKFAENVGKFIFGEKQEKQSRPEGEPLVDHAERVRRFARNVMNHVFGTARAEQKHGREWDGQDPLNTEPLVDAAEDLDDAVEDLDDATRSYRESSGDYGGASRRERDESSGGGFAARAAERMARRLEQLEHRVQTEAEKNEARAAALRAGLGIMAVAGVLLIGHISSAQKNPQGSKAASHGSGRAKRRNYFAETTARRNDAP